MTKKKMTQAERLKWVDNLFADNDKKEKEIWENFGRMKKIFEGIDKGYPPDRIVLEKKNRH